MSKKKNITFKAIVTILTFIITELLNETSLDVWMKISISIFIIIVLIVFYLYFKIDKVDVNTYLNMREDLFEIRNTLNVLQYRNQTIPIENFDITQDFIQKYNPKCNLNSFTDKKAKRKLSSFLNSLREVNKISSENNRINRRSINIVRLDFSGTNGDFDKNKIVSMEKKRLNFENKLINCINKYKEFYNYCENKYYTD